MMRIAWLLSMILTAPLIAAPLPHMAKLSQEASAMKATFVLLVVLALSVPGFAQPLLSAPSASSPVQVDCKAPATEGWATVEEITLPFVTGPPIKLQRFLWTRRDGVRRSFNLTYVIASAESAGADFILHIRGMLVESRDAFLRMNNTFCNARGDRETYEITQTYDLPTFFSIPSTAIEPMIDASRPLAQSYIAWLRVAGVPATLRSEILVPRIVARIVTPPPWVRGDAVHVSDRPFGTIQRTIDF